MNTNLILASNVAQACGHVVVAPTGAGFEGRAVSAAGMTVVADRRRTDIGVGTDLLPTWRKRPTTDRFIRLRTP